MRIKGRTAIGSDVVRTLSSAPAELPPPGPSSQHRPPLPCPVLTTLSLHSLPFLFSPTPSLLLPSSSPHDAAPAKLPDSQASEHFQSFLLLPLFDIPSTWNFLPLGFNTPNSTRLSAQPQGPRTGMDRTGGGCAALQVTGGPPGSTSRRHVAGGEQWEGRGPGSPDVGVLTQSSSTEPETGPPTPPPPTLCPQDEVSPP